MDIGHRRLRRRNEEKFAQSRGVRPFLYSIILVGKFGELPHAHHAIAVDQKGRRNLRVTVLSDMQIEQKLDQRPLQPRSPTSVKKKAAAGQFRPAREINQLEA